MWDVVKQKEIGQTIYRVGQIQIVARTTIDLYVKSMAG